ncbi:MAG TPA: CDP-alcohol phosphatidyltransferase family protein [Polyangiaceae bacterium]
MADRSGSIKRREARESLLLPRAVLEAALWCLERVADRFIALGVTANAITVSSVVLAAIGGVLLGYGHFGGAAAAMVAASLGDALDGLVARRSGTASVAGALLDASVDRYEEFLFLGGLAVYFRESTPALLLTLGALAGSFMVSYGSAKAEALGVPVPPGVMRRAERAVCLCAGVALMPCFAWAVRAAVLPAWAERAPIFVALGLVAVVANVSAVRRLRALARGRATTAAVVLEAAPESDRTSVVAPEPVRVR